MRAQLCSIDIMEDNVNYFHLYLILWLWGWLVSVNGLAVYSLIIVMSTEAQIRHQKGAVTYGEKLAGVAILVWSSLTILHLFFSSIIIIQHPGWCQGSIIDYSVSEKQNGQFSFISQSNLRSWIVISHWIFIRCMNYKQHSSFLLAPSFLFCSNSTVNYGLPK